MNPQQSASSPADSPHTDSLHAEAREVLRRLTGVMPSSTTASTRRFTPS